jgi:type IV pilus assembly protein PilX
MESSGLINKESGVVLVVSLIMLMLITLIGVSAMQNTGLEEKMAGNLRDRNMAFQAAEAALRDAEADISNVGGNVPPRISGVSDFTVDCGAATPNVGDDGLCYSFPALDYVGANIAPPNPITWPTVNMMTGAPSVPYGRFTGAQAIQPDRLSAQPRYIIQAINGLGAYCNSRGGKFCYRITVRAQGANPNTVVWLQSIFIP